MDRLPGDIRASSKAQSDESPRGSPAAPPSLFWYAVGLAIVLSVPKLVHMRGGSHDYLTDVIVATHADTLFVVSFALLGAVVVRLGRRAARWLVAVWVALAGVSALYGVASIFTWNELRAPLTYRLIYLGADLGNMRSSLSSSVNGWVVTSLVVTPLAYLLVSRVLTRRLPPRPAVVALATALAMVHVVAGSVGFRRHWHDRQDERLVQNPHAELLYSCASELIGESTQQIGGEFLPEDLYDFAAPPAPPPLRPVRRRPTNVVLYVLESVGSEHLGVYGSPFPTTPHLDAEAEHAAVVDAFYTNAPISATALVAMSLGTHAPIHWKPATAIVRQWPSLPPTLAEVLKPLGYHTFFVSSGDFAFSEMGDYLRPRGFDEFVDVRTIGQPPIFSWGTEDAHVVNRLVDWIDRHRAARPGEPFFAMTWTGQNHHPYAVADPRRAIDFAPYARPGTTPMSPPLNRYLNAVRENDAHLGRLFAALRERGIAEDTLVVIVGDHGEGFGWPHDCRTHGRDVYEAAVRIPCILWAPGVFDRRTPVRTVAGHVDLNATVLHLLGLPAPSRWTGRSVLDPARPGRTYFYAANHDYFLGVRDGSWKYIYNAMNGREQLFDLTADPHEQHNLAATHADRSTRMRQRLAAWTHAQLRE